MPAIRWPLVRELLRKDLEEVSRSRQLLYPMFVFPIFITGDSLLIMSAMAAGSNAGPAALADSFFRFGGLLLVVPVVVPTLLGSSSVVMEKNNRTLEALLSTPLTDTELLLGKALAPLVPALALTAASFIAYGTGAALVVNAHAPGTSLPWVPFLVSAIVIAPILAALSTCVSVAVSTKAKDMRSAQQLSTFVMLPPLIVVIVLAIALGPSLRSEALFALVFAVLTVAVLRITVQRFQRDQILVAGL